MCDTDVMQPESRGKTKRFLGKTNAKHRCKFKSLIQNRPLKLREGTGVQVQLYSSSASALEGVLGQRPTLSPDERPAGNFGKTRNLIRTSKFETLLGGPPGIEDK
jgi:hypothetical protein